MIDKRRQQRNIPAKYSFSDLLNMFKTEPADTPRSRQKLKQLKTIQEGLNIPPVVPMAAPSLLETQPQELATDLMQVTPTTNITTGQTVNIETLMKPLLSEPKTQNNLLTKKEEEEIAKNPETLQKYSRAGNFFSRLSGFQTASPELLAQASPEELDMYNKQRLTARNKGIGEMLFMLSDALGGKDIAIRALERQKAKQPAKEELTAAQRNYQTYLEIAKTGTPSEVQLAATALLGVRQGKSKEQLRNEVIASLTKQNNPITGEPYSEEDIKEQIKILDNFFDNSNETDVEANVPLSFKVPGYTITEG
jgi:hypothetical protein